MTTKLWIEVKLSNEQRDALDGAILKIQATRDVACSREWICSSPFRLAVEPLASGGFAVAAISGPSTMYLTQDDVSRLQKGAGGFVLPIR
jgi:hypothetical protein